MKPQRRWMISVLAEAAREAANPTLMPWQSKKAAAPARAAHATVMQPPRLAARA